MIKVRYILLYGFGMYAAGILLGYAIWGAKLYGNS